MKPGYRANIFHDRPHTKGNLAFYVSHGGQDLHLFPHQQPFTAQLQLLQQCEMLQQLAI
jgi:hypothetical protein